MKKIICLMTIALMGVAAFAQTVTLTFTGKDANNHYVQLNRVAITNLTKGWQETIYWPDTTLTMQNGTGIDESVANGGFALSQNNPNPFSGTTDVNLTVADAGAVTLEIVDGNGKIVETRHGTSLQPGTHQFRVSLSAAGTYVMTARQNGKTSSIKMVCNGGGNANGMDYHGMLQTITFVLKSTTNNPFNFGDMMEYVGYATINGTEVESQRITQAQGASQTFVLQFDVTQIQEQIPTVYTSVVTGITQNAAIVGGTVTSDGGSAVFDRGICWNTTGTPTLNDNCLHIGSGTGAFSDNLTGLTEETTYYMRAYAINSIGIAYGNEENFTTMTETGQDGQPCPSAATLTDIDGNTYNTVQIGQQCWMKENLRTTKYADGTSISQGSSHSTTVAYWYYPNNYSYTMPTYGLLYNWKAVMRNSSSSSTNPNVVQGICPDGWHVPIDAEWKQMEMAVGMSQSDADDIGYRGNIAAKLSGNTGWTSSINANAAGNWNAPDRNSTGFSALPAGYCDGFGSYGFGNYASFWSATEASSTRPYYRSLNYNYAEVYREDLNKGYGNSVRCLRDGGAGPVPTVITAAVSDITATTAISGGDVTDDGGAPVTARGVCWSSTSQNPTIADSHTTDGNGTGSFTSSITGLTPNYTFYYVRAYATNSAGTSYGYTQQFITNPASQDGPPCPNAATLTDRDGNTYNTVLIGTQCWMKENLRTTKYADNTPIAQGSDTSTTTAYWYYPNDDASNKTTYGLLYNWLAIMRNSSSSSSNPSGVQGICPDGWHVPSDAEWTQLTDYVSSQSEYVCGSDNTCIAKALAGTTGWSSSTNICAVGIWLSQNNATGFSALPAGGYFGSYLNFGDYAYFSSATTSGDGVYYRNLAYYVAGVGRGNHNKSTGFSVRCLRD